MNAHITVWRLENKDTRVGPFSGNGQDVYDKALPEDDGEDDAEMSCADGPGPTCWREEDTKLYDFFKRGRNTGGHYFAFANLRSYQSWFSHRGGLQALAEIGIVLAEYRVDPYFVKAGYSQVAFKRSMAKHVADHHPAVRTGLPVCIPSKEVVV